MAAERTGGWDLGADDLERLLQEAAAIKGESLWQDAWRRLKRNRASMVSLAFLVLVGLTSLFAPLLPLPAPGQLDLQDEPQPPVMPWTELGSSGWSAEEGYWELNPFDSALLSVREALFGDWQTGHWMGTDSKGRDLFSRIVWGSRTSIQVALVAAIFSLLIGVTYGAVSGYLGGRVDNLMMRIVDVLYSIPFIFVVIFLITMLASKDLDNEFALFLCIGAIYWLTMARVVRGQVLSLKNSEFIEAARVLGASMPRIVFVHLVPNVLSVVIVYLTLTIPAIMLFEAFLSFLGLGITEPKVSWGLLATDATEAISPVKSFLWLVFWPAGAMGFTLLALNVLGDGLRDALDPKLRGKD